MSSYHATAAVVASTDPSSRPTRDKVMRIAEMTHSGQATLEKIQQTLFIRIAHPESYKPREIENTLTVIQQCTFISSLAFVTFFQERTYAIAALANYSGSPSDQHTISRIQSKAKILSQFLQDDEFVQRERRRSVVPVSSGGSESAPRSNAIAEEPARGRTLRTWRDWNSAANTLPPGSTYLPTPEPSPERGSSVRNFRQSEDFSSVSNAAEDAISEEIEQEVRKVIEASSPHIDNDKIEAIAYMTFGSEKFDVLIRVLVESLFDRHEGNDSYLVKTLTIIRYCLIKGSPRFFRWFLESRGIIGALRISTTPAVLTLAEEILHRLDGGLEASRSSALQSWSSSPHSPRLSDFSFATPTTITQSSSFTLQEPVKDLTAFITTVGEHPIASGGYSIVYKAILSVGQSAEEVAKKILSSHNISPARLEKRVNREVRAWTRLSHPNIASLYGFTREKNGSIGLISPFFENGNIEEYLKRVRPDVDVLKLMIEITLGVEYLHNQEIVHGDIKSSNIMVDKDGHPKLIDFGVSRVTGESGNTTSSPGISWAYAAPELLLLDDNEPVPKTKASDVYALATTFVEIMAGRVPYRGMSSYAILERAKHGGGPDRPLPDEECNFYPGDGLWALLLCCWSRKPEDRPAIETVRDGLLMLDGSA